MQEFSSWVFLKDVLVAALASYGGPEAHYGVFQAQLVEDKNYLTEEELTELIGLYSLVPGPGSTQTITAIGYHLGGPVLAILTFLVWALPAIFIMALAGVFFTYFKQNETWQDVLTYLPAVAVGFIIYAAIKMTKKVNKSRADWLVYLVMVLLSFLLAPRSIWAVPLLLVAGGLVHVIPNLGSGPKESLSVQVKWWILGLIVGIAILNEWLNQQIGHPILNIFTSFYRYGYSAMGGGQIVIPLMIQELVQAQALISNADFLSGYAIDQAVPGPLFSFAAFVSARALDGSSYALLGGVIGGLAIFLPGILLVFFIFPLWRDMRQHRLMKDFLKGVTLTVAALITMTAISQVLALDAGFSQYLVVTLSSLALLFTKIPAFLLVLAAGLLGFII